ncbi:hypothetical protein BH11GEM1_BH11GEM1_06590 [soil metagenome]
MLRRTLQHLATVLSTVALVSACGKGEKAEDSAKKADSIAVAAPVAAPAPAPAPALSDANVLAKLDADNVADSSAGAMAVAKGTSASVKEFGRMMMKDHHAMRVEGAALASKAGITPALPPGDADAAADATVADSMTSMPKGAAWDKFFADHQVDGHTKVLQFAQDAANRTQNADLKAMIQKAAPTVEKHLVKAKAIQGALGSATAKAPR